MKLTKSQLQNKGKEKPLAQVEVMHSKKHQQRSHEPNVDGSVGRVSSDLGSTWFQSANWTAGTSSLDCLVERSRYVCWIAYLSCLGYVAYTSIRYGQPEYILMLLLIPLMGITHPPSRNDNVALGLPRQLIGFASLAIPLLCIPMRPIIVL